MLPVSKISKRQHNYYSSRRDPTVSPLLFTISCRKLQRPSVTVLFITQLFLQQLDKRSRKPSQGRENKNRPGGQRQSHGSSISVRPITQSVIGLLMAHRLPRAGRVRRKRSCFVACRKCCVFYFYVTSVIILSGLRSLLQAMTQLTFSSSCGGIMSRYLHNENNNEHWSSG